MSVKTKIFIFLLISALFSCNPVKRVIKDENKLKIVAKEVIKRGYCINDTIIIDTSRIDTVVQQNYIIDTISIKQNIDTTLPSGAQISIKDGVVSVKCPSNKVITKTITETQYIRDLKLESILKEELNTKSDSIEYLTLTIKDQLVTIRDKNVTIAKEKAKFIVLIIALGILLCVFIYSKFKLF